MHLSDSQIGDLAILAKTLNIEVASLAAIIEVESGGVIFAKGMSGQYPVIRWEGHYFYRFLKGVERDLAVREGLASPNAGAVKNPSDQASRYRMMHRGMDINATSALSSVSMGVGQVMGSHWKALGFKSPAAMFERAMSGFKGQVEIMLAFIVENGLVDELQRRDWSAFARAYNGKNYAKHGYHTKIAKAYKRQLADPRISTINVPNTSKGSASTMLRLGSKGARVRELQQLLVRSGHSLTVDGDFGPATKEAVIAFQSINGLEVDGVAGPRTVAALSQYRAADEIDVGKQVITEIPETVTGGSTAVGGIGVVAAAEKLNDVADKLSAADGIWQHLANGMYAVGGVLIVGGLLWTAYGYLKSRKTYEGLSA